MTYQLTSMGRIDPDLSLTDASTTRGSSEASEVASNQLICKKIQPSDGILFRLSPSIQSSPLFVIPPSLMQPLNESPFSRFYVAVPSVPSVGLSAEDIQSEIPEGALAAPPPLMASLCVSQDSPRPFPVLFAPPPPSQFGSIDNDFRNIFMNPSDASIPFPGVEDPLKVSLNVPSMGGVTLGLHGVPATIESSSPSQDDPAGRILIKLHTNPPGSITLGFTEEGRTSRRPEDFETAYGLYRRSGVLTPSMAPSVSLVFSRPVGSIGIGSANSPAVNIEKQNIITSTANSPEKTVPKDWTLHKAALSLR